MRTNKRRDSGAVAVEFALVLPLLVVLTFGILEFGRAYNQLVAIQGAAREGARAYSLQKSVTEVQNAVISSTAIGLTSSDVTLGTACPADAVLGTTAQATVTVSKQFDFILPLWTAFNRKLTATASMRCGL